MNILSWIGAQSRAVKIALVGLAAIVAYFAAVEPMVEATASAHTAADARQAALERLRQKAANDQDSEALAVRKFGKVELPADINSRTLKLNQQVTAVLEKHGVRQHTSSTKISPIGQGPMQAAAGPTSQISRYVREVQFEASPETVTAVVADLERTPEVAEVSRVQLRRGGETNRDDRVLRATLSVEAWVESPKGQGRAR